MKTDDHANHVPTYSLSPEQLDQWFARTTADLVDKREARLRTEAWPHNVEQALLAAVARIGDLYDRVAALEAGRG